MQVRTLVCAVGALLSLAACGQGYSGAEPLPNWATPEELALRGQTSAQALTVSVAPTGQFRLPAEFEPTRAVVVTYAAFTDLLDGVARGVTASGAELWAVGGPASIDGVVPELYHPLEFAYDSVWARDYGPMGVDLATRSLAIVDTTYRHWEYRVADDAIPCEVAGYAGAECHQTSLILDGGNLMSDGQGNLFLTRRIYDWNSSMTEDQVDQLLRDYLGATTIHKFPYAINSKGAPADGTGHIDMFAKILKQCTVLVAQSTSKDFQATLDAAAAQFASIECARGRTYDVIRVPGWYTASTWYTYTNSLIVNDHVLVPSYKNGDDALAKQIYQQALPGYTVEMMPSDNIIKLGGSVHCITKEIPVTPL